jgi:hypothetical protein
MRPSPSGNGDILEMEAYAKECGFVLQEHGIDLAESASSEGFYALD